MEEEEEASKDEEERGRGVLECREEENGSVGISFAGGEGPSGVVRVGAELPLEEIEE